MKTVAVILVAVAVLFGACGVWWGACSLGCAAVQAWTWDDGLEDGE